MQLLFVSYILTCSVFCIYIEYGKYAKERRNSHPPNGHYIPLPHFQARILLFTLPWSSLTPPFWIIQGVGRKNQALTSTFYKQQRWEGLFPPTQIVILIGKHSCEDVAIATHRLPLTVCSFPVLRAAVSLAMFVTVFLNREAEATKVFRLKLLKRKNPSCWILFFSIPHSVSTKRFTCHYRLPSSFNKRSKRKRLALSGRVWLFKTIGILV